MLFSVQDGEFFCRGCSKRGRLITPGVLTAMKHIIYNPVDRVYSFTLSRADEKTLEFISEKYLLHQTGKTFKTLDFYKSLQ